MILSIIIFAILEAYRNYYIIEKLKKSPHVWVTWVLRGTVFIVINTVFGFSWIKAICSLFIFQSTFNLALNYLRGKPLNHYGQEGIDKFKKPYWVWIDFALAIAAICYVLFSN